MTSIETITVDESSLHVLDALVPHTEAREAERQEIARLTEEFLARGGRVEILPPGPMEFEQDEVPEGEAKPVQPVSTTQRRRGVLHGLTAGAREIGVSSFTLQSYLLRGDGPPHTKQDRFYTFERKSLREWAAERGVGLRAVVA